MAEGVYKENTTATTETKKKGFFSNMFKSSNADKSQEEEPPKNQTFMSSLMGNARQAATKEVMHIAEHEATKQVESAINNNDNGTSQTTSNVAPDTQTTPTDVANGATSWAKRMVDNAQQKVQNLQNIGS